MICLQHGNNKRFPLPARLVLEHTRGWVSSGMKDQGWDMAHAGISAQFSHPRQLGAALLVTGLQQADLTRRYFLI